MTLLYLCLKYHIALRGGDSIEKEKWEKLQEVLGWANGFVKETGYVAGTEKITLADLCFLSTLSSVAAAGSTNELDAKHYLNRYLKYMKRSLTI